MKTTYGLDKKREAVLEALKEAFTEQNLDEQTYEERVSSALQASSVEELSEVLFDFPQHITAKIFQSTPQKYNTSTPYVPKRPLPVALNKPMRAVLAEHKRQVMVLQEEEPTRISCILGTQKLNFSQAQIQGDHLVLDVENYLGETVLDLRNHQLEGRTLDVYIEGALGDVKILVPQGVSIQNDMSLILGDFKTRGNRARWFNKIKQAVGVQTPQEAIAPPVHGLIRFHGTFWLGSIRVIT